VSVTTRIDNCTAYPTVGDLETKFILPKCGTTAICHATGSAFPPDMAKPEMWKRFVGISNMAATACKAPYIDKADPAKSFIVVKVKGTMINAPVACPVGGAPAGTLMPFAMAPLPAAEITCLENYAKAVAK
jgi:hypothetical protein